DLWKLPYWREAMKKLKDQRRWKDAFETSFGIPEEGIARSTTAFYKQQHWDIIETVSSFDEAKVREKMGDPKEQTPEGKKYWKCKAGCVHFVSSYMFVHARNEEGMKTALTNSVNRKSGPLDDALAYLTSGRQIVSGSYGADYTGADYISEIRYTSVSGNICTN